MVLLPLKMTLSQCPTPATRVARCLHLTQPQQCDSPKARNNTRLKCCAFHTNEHGHLQSAAPAAKHASHLRKTSQKYCTCHTERLLTPYETCWDVTKCHTCHTKWRCATFQTSKTDHFSSSRYRHGHRVPTAVVLPMVADTEAASSEHRSTPRPKVKREPFATHSGKNNLILFHLHLRNILPSFAVAEAPL